MRETLSKCHINDDIIIEAIHEEGYPRWIDISHQSDINHSITIFDSQSALQLADKLISYSGYLKVEK